MNYNLILSKIIVKLLLIVFIIVTTLVGYLTFYPQQLPNNSYQLVITDHMSIRNLSNQLEQLHIIKSKLIFYNLIKILHKDRHIKAGLYSLKNSISTWGLIRRLVNSKPDQISVTILDGWKFEQLKQYIDQLPNIKHSTVTQSESQIKDLLKITAPNLEGQFYPSTYFVVPNQLDLEVYQQAYRLMEQKLAVYYNQRNHHTLYNSPYQLLIMASLIQKETDNPNEMVIISAVFNNRLQRHMKLQNDPSVLYGLRNYKHITHNDFLYHNTPYNTYMNFGLPPTPICNPSDNALYAAANPIPDLNVLFFIADKGVTKFANTFADHQRNILLSKKES
jgi:UPF0755 protein